MRRYLPLPLILLAGIGCHKNDVQIPTSDPRPHIVADRDEAIAFLFGKQYIGIEDDGLVFCDPSGFFTGSTEYRPPLTFSGTTWYDSEGNPIPAREARKMLEDMGFGGKAK